MSIVARISASTSTMMTCVFLTFFTMLFFSAGRASAQEARFQRSFDVNKGAMLVVNNRKGTVHISGSDSSQVVISVWKRFSGPDKAKKSWLNETVVNFTTDSMRPKVEVSYPDHDCDNDACEGRDVSEVELTIRVPHQINLELVGRKPDIAVSSIEGNISIESHKSPILIESTKGAIHIVSHKNDVKLKNVSIVGKLDLNIENGSAEIEARTLGDETNLETTKGNITIHIPKDTGAVVEFTGGSRSVFQSDFPLDRAPGHAIREVSGTINQGGSHMHLKTDKGAIFLRKSSASI
jgi:putative adhesin